jgi:asparagine synthase (glutamine-hydrolysing)
MCGIVGFVGVSNDRELIKMMEAQAHRGPDEQGIFKNSNGNLHLGASRLQIIGKKNGRQPKKSKCGNYVLIFNGEIYNKEFLIERLLQNGLDLSESESDTEILVELFSVFKEKSLDFLNGMFSFVIYDKRDDVLFCARDHVGIKPFFYTLQQGKFGFASEIKSLLALSWTESELNSESIYHYLSLNFIPSPMTAYKNIFSLKPGNYIKYEIKTNCLTEVNYWVANRNNKKYSAPRDEITKQIHSKLEDAVIRSSESDYPIAVSLSGGLDSAIIAGLLSKNSEIPIHTFSLSFPQYPEINEEALVSEIVRHFKTNHHEVKFNKNEFLKNIDNMVYSMDQPYAGGLPSWIIFREISQNFKVAMTGVGGDELFGNYGKWVGNANSYQFFKSLLIKINKGDFDISDLKNHEIITYFPHNFSEKSKRMLLNQKIYQFDRVSTKDFILNKIDKNLDYYDRIFNLDLHFQLSDEFNLMVDHFSMAHSLEVRPPFLDRDFIEFVAKIPTYQKASKLDYKKLLKDSFADFLPPSVLEGKKKGFIIPISDFLENEMKKEVLKYSSKNYLKRQNIFDFNAVSNLISSFEKNPNRFTNKIWAWFMFQKWWEGKVR